ncbi:hypothetical protein GCM10009760_01640 [Kitasatospora kazusensis]|uniref:Uncharacterized protein n=1 Tax=Kitasatospora kazusensis TaxID=407974 RepID=A0ABN2YMX9_9ACTN
MALLIRRRARPRPGPYLPEERPVSYLLWLLFWLADAVLAGVGVRELIRRGWYR